MTQFAIRLSACAPVLERVRQDAKIAATVRVGLPGPRVSRRCCASRRGAALCHGQRDGEVRVSITQLLITAGPSALIASPGALKSTHHGDVRSLLSFRRPKEDRGWNSHYTTVQRVAWCSAHAPLATALNESL